MKIATKQITNQVNLAEVIAMQVLKTTRDTVKRRKAEKLIEICHMAKPTRADFKRITTRLYRLAL
mgnify:CR=1 FL=1